MNKIATIAGLALAASAMTASADNLLLVDLSSTNQITISATGGLSAASVSVSNFTGWLLADFYSSTVHAGLADSAVSGDLTVAGTTSDGSPDLFRGGVDAGLNVWSFSNDSGISFTAGAVAFTGSATWDVDAAMYADMLAGNSGGDIYAPADTDDDISGATLIGTWSVVPAPSSLALLGLGGIVAGRRRR